MIERLFLRNTFYGSPFKNLDAGRDERDFENKEKLQKALNNYLKTDDIKIEGTLAKQTFENQVSEERSKFTYYLAPVAALLVGKFLGDAYLAPKSVYLKGIFIAGAFCLFYKYALDVENSRQVSFWLGSFQQFPPDVQLALKSYDARYVSKWIE